MYVCGGEKERERENYSSDIFFLIELLSYHCQHVFFRPTFFAVVHALKSMFAVIRDDEYRFWRATVFERKLLTHRTNNEINF